MNTQEKEMKLLEPTTHKESRMDRIMRVLGREFFTLTQTVYDDWNFDAPCISPISYAVVSIVEEKQRQLLIQLENEGRQNLVTEAIKEIRYFFEVLKLLKSTEGPLTCELLQKKVNAISLDNLEEILVLIGLIGNGKSISKVYNRVKNFKKIYANYLSQCIQERNILNCKKLAKEIELQYAFCCDYCNNLNCFSESDLILFLYFYDIKYQRNTKHK